MKELSNQEVAQLHDLLNKCQVGSLPPIIFEDIARIAVYSAVEFIPMRRFGERVEVLLFKRPANDIVWPSMLHTPGTILRPTDTGHEDAFKRLRSDELKDLDVGEPLFIGNHLSRNARGTCLLMEYILEVKGEPSVGSFYDVENIPDTFIEEQQPSLDRAVAAFRKL